MDDACAYCDKPIVGDVEFSIHRDGFGKGLEVPLCAECGGGETPTCEDIWERIRDRRCVTRLEDWRSRNG